MTQSKGDRTREALRASAVSYFRDLGYQAATTADIARAAGVSEATLFLHYSNKAGLLTAVTADFYQRLQSIGEGVVVAEGLTDGERLRSLVDSWAEVMSRDWDLIQVFVQAAQNQPGTELAQLVIDANRRYTRLYSGLIDRLKAAGSMPDAPTNLLRDMIFGALEHTARGQQYAGRPIDTWDAGHQILALLTASSSPTGESRLDGIDRKLDALLDRLDGGRR